MMRAAGEASACLLGSVDAAKVARKLKKRGYVEIKDFLQPRFADQIHRYLVETKDASEWQIAIHDGQNTSYLPNLESRRDDVLRHYRAAALAFAEGRFSYCFRRTLGVHADPCSCGECRLRRLFQSPPLHRLMSRLGAPISALGESFLSCYLRGDFLAPHHDLDKGRLAFSLNLTKAWRPQFGGHLCILSKDWTRPERTFSPTFNSLVLFEVADRESPHFVSHVVTGRRLAYTGWLE
ncbi:MAG: hypothetical protein E7812_00315 [Phenylobacterium sp.]|nr:MAG: hypothetical protein E7812_00315 [Phenylobacterium sp.]